MGMRVGGRGQVSTLIVAAVVGLVFALAGSAGAASRGSSNRDDTVQACVATQDTVHRVTGGVDQATGGLTNPVTQVANSIVDGVNQATADAVSDITESIAPASSVLIVPTGTPCPTGYTSQTLTAPPTVDIGQSTGRVALAKGKVPIAMTAVTSPGPYMVSATVDLAETGLSAVAQTVKCVLVDGANMQTIPGTTSTGTFPSDSSGMDLPVTINSYLPDVPVGELAVDCKDPQLAATTSRAARTASLRDVSAVQCQVFGGFVQSGKCVRGPLNGEKISSSPPNPPTATGKIQATSAPPRTVTAIACQAGGGSVAFGNLCVGGLNIGATVKG